MRPRLSSKFHTSIAAFERLLTPPFTGAAAVLWALFIFFFACNTSPLMQGNLSDPDDYLYLTQAIDWLQGQSWFDPLQHRMNPPGTFIHYPHLLSGFYALWIFLLKPFTGMAGAALVTSYLLPPIYLGILFFVLRKIAEDLIAEGWGDITAIIVFFSSALLSQFMPGHLDHHGLVTLLSVAGFGCIARMIKEPASLKWPLAAGGVLALALVLALETLPAIGILAFGTGLWAMAEGRAAAKSGFIFSLSLFVASFVLLFLTRGPDALFQSGTLYYSIAYVLLTGCFLVCFCGVELAARSKSSVPRFVIGLTLAAITGCLFLFRFPALLTGPYGNMDPALAKMIFAAEPEAWPLFHRGAGWSHMLLPLIWPLIAMGVSMDMLKGPGRKDERWIWTILFLLMATFTVLAAFYQCRMMYYAQAFGTLPLTALLRQEWLKYQKARQSKKRILHASLFCFVLLLGIFSAVGAGNYSDDTPAVASRGCDMHALAEQLNDPKNLGHRPHIIINSINEGPELLFRTKHDVLAGPYHLNVAGNADALHFFSAQSTNEALSIAARRKADLVILCTSSPEMKIYAGTENNFLQQIMKGKLPGWLHPITVSPPNDLRLFSISLPAKMN